MDTFEAELAGPRIWKRAYLLTSQEAPLRKRHHAIARDHEVIKGAYVDKCKRLLKRLSQQFVRARGLRNARRMVMREDDRGGVVSERCFDDLSRVNTGLG